jgi:iron(III) transport system ATP-binding protein
LDEPFSGLDASLRAETREAVLHALAAQGTTAVLVTHDQAEALSTGREVAVLRSGRLVQTAPPSALYRTPVDLDVARFVGEAVVLAGEARAGKAATALGELEMIDPTLEGHVDVMIRPEQIELHAPGARGSTGATAAKLIGSTFYGPDTLVELEIPGLATPARARTLRGHETPPPGGRIEVSVLGPVMAYPAGQVSDLDPAGAQRVGTDA